MMARFMRQGCLDTMPAVLDTLVIDTLLLRHRGFVRNGGKRIIWVGFLPELGKLQAIPIRLPICRLRSRSTPSRWTVLEPSRLLFFTMEHVNVGGLSPACAVTPIATTWSTWGPGVPDQLYFQEGPDPLHLECTGRQTPTGRPMSATWCI